MFTPKKHHHFNHIVTTEIFSRKVSWSNLWQTHNLENHIRDIHAKTNAALAFIKSNINFFPSHIKSNCHKIFVRPISSPIWAPHLRTSRCVRTIYCSSMCTEWLLLDKQCYHYVKLIWLECCRAYSKLVMLYGKLINCQIEVPSLSLSPICIYTRGYSQYFRPLYASYLFSFNNNLPEKIVNQPILKNLYMVCIVVKWSLNVVIYLYCLIPLHTCHLCVILCTEFYTVLNI